MEGLLKINQESIIEKPKIKEGVDFVFEQNPKLLQIGTKEQYSKYLDTVFPNSVIKDILYAGSEKDFEKFKTNDNPDMKNFGIYFGSWISHYFGEVGRGYKYRKTVILNITNPRIINNITLTDEAKAENNESIGLGSADARNIKRFYNIKKEDGIIQLGHDHGNSDVAYDESVDIYNKETASLLNKLFPESRNNLDSFFNELISNIDLQKSTHAVLKEYVKLGNELGNLAQEVLVFDPKQINILGSEQDLENFKKFVENNQDSQS